jgi:hypothetical protein
MLIPMKTPGTGADIESICSKCGDVWHVVVAKVGEKIARVQCKECGKEHRHKPLASATAAEKKAKPVGAPSARSLKAAAKARAEATPIVDVDTSKPVRTYKASELFTPGERIAHPTFGQGIAEVSPGPGKIQVFFPEGRRILAMAKADSTLMPRGK